LIFFFSDESKAEENVEEEGKEVREERHRYTKAQARQRFKKGRS
jgi:hypothetical protein